MCSLYQRLVQPDILPQLSNLAMGSLIMEHVCIGSDWKECYFIYGSLILITNSKIRTRA